ncbi:MAG: hypothetical protein ACT4PP_14525 [Sporichthyaceae bacterium]
MTSTRTLTRTAAGAFAALALVASAQQAEAAVVLERQSVIISSPAAEMRGEVTWTLHPDTDGGKISADLRGQITIEPGSCARVVTTGVSKTGAHRTPSAISGKVCALKRTEIGRFSVAPVSARSLQCLNYALMVGPLVGQGQQEQYRSAGNRRICRG